MPADLSEALRGPWVAVCADGYGFIYDNPEDLEEDGDYVVSVRRGTAAPIDGELPGSYQGADLLFELDDLFLDDDDPSNSVAHRFAQAQACAAGLNAAGGSSTPEGAQLDA